VARLVGVRRPGEREQWLSGGSGRVRPRRRPRAAVPARISAVSPPGDQRPRAAFTSSAPSGMRARKSSSTNGASRARTAEDDNDSACGNNRATLDSADTVARPARNARRSRRRRAGPLSTPSDRSVADDQDALPMRTSQRGDAEPGRLFKHELRNRGSWDDGSDDPLCGAVVHSRRCRASRHRRAGRPTSS